MRMGETKQSTTTVTYTPNNVIEVDDRMIALDNDGYLMDMSDWSEKVAENMASADGIEFGTDHRIQINFLIRFYKEFEVVPGIHILSRNFCKDQQECRWTLSYINMLFPNRARTACRYAGLPVPVNGCD